MSKRMRLTDGATSGGTYSSSQRKAMAINSRINTKYPYATHGRSYSKRGSAQSLDMYGPTYKTASAGQQAARKEYGYVGRGKYWGKALGGYAGSYFGSKGRKLGSYLGDKASDYAVKRFKGRGLYQGRGSYNNLVSGGDMSMSGAGNETEAVTFTNREYIKDIYGPTNGSFTNLDMSLNPGLEHTFPWLAQIAANYEEYEFIQLLFEFKSTVNASTGGDGQTGTIIMATNYNASEATFTDKASMMQYHGGQSGRLTDDLIHGVECDPSKSVGDMHKYVRTDPVKDDIKSYDHGKFNFAIANMPGEFADQQVGELWVSYTVKLLKPKLGCARLVNQSIDRFSIRPIMANNAPIAATSSQDLNCGTTRSDQVYEQYDANSIGCALDENSTLIFPATETGTFEVTVKGRLQVQGVPLDSFDASDLALDGILGGQIIKSNTLLMPSPQVTNVDTYDHTTPLPVTWMHSMCETQQMQQIGAGSATIICHMSMTLRVSTKAAVGALNNSIALKILNNSTQVLTISARSFTVDVTEIKDMVQFKDKSVIPAPVV